jgi:putative oxidoreductase
MFHTMEWIKNNLDRTFLLRFGLMVIMIMHGLPPFIEMSVIDFGNALTEAFGFGFIGVPMAIMIKLIHVVTIAALLLNKYLKPLAILNIIIFIMGIVLIHWRHGWYVVGGGSEGVEFNFLLIFSFATFIFPNGLVKQDKPAAKELARAA